MHPKKLTLLASALVITIGATSTAFGFAEVARGKLTASTKLAYEYDSNIFANSSEISDYSLVFTPTLSYARNVGTISTAAQLGFRAISFQDTSGQNSIDPTLIVNFNADRAEKGRVSQSLSYTRRSDANETLNTRTKSDEVRSSTLVDYYFSEKTGLRFDVTYRLSDYKTAGYNNVTSYGLGGGLVYKYSPKLTGFATYSYSPEKATNLGANPASNPSSKNHRFKLGFEGQLAPKLAGKVSAGLAYRKFDLGGDTSALFLASALSWTANEKTNLTLSASNDFDTTPGAESAKNFSVGLSARHALTAKFSLGANVGYRHSQLDQRPGPTTRTDKAKTVGATATYRVFDNFNLNGSLSHRLNDSTLARADYERNIYSLAAAYTF